MRSTLRERWSEWQHSAERTLAPHVEESWAGDLMTELRLQGVSGAMIAETLSEVESHCAESGELAEDEFGDATEYARSLKLPRSKDDTVAAIAAATAPVVVQVVGMLAMLWAVAALAVGGDLELTSGQVIWTILFVGVVAGVVCFSEKVLRFLFAHPVVTFLVFMALSASVGVVQLVARDVVATVSAAPVLIVASAVLVAATVWAWARTGNSADEDVIASPLAQVTSDTASAREDASAGKPYRGGRFSLLVYLTVPAYTILSLAFTWWMLSG